MSDAPVTYDMYSDLNLGFGQKVSDPFAVENTHYGSTVHIEHLPTNRVFIPTRLNALTNSE